MKKIMIPAGMAENEFTLKKSKFISLVYPVLDDLEVKSHLKRLRQEHPGSSHVVWSYVLGDAGTLYGLSDDGEPHGTAGRPVLEVLKGSGLTFITLFVIRYFGGTKLGTGGLVSAYTRAAQEVLSLVETREKMEYSRVALVCSYSQFEGIKSILEQAAIQDLQEEFTDLVHLKGEVPDKYREACQKEIQDYSSGQVNLIVQE
ncbi:YigZ family protein [Oceanispirochaeta sp.]|jgi:uncharacterized YigZ family protein|uniref:IMPACT family protein n=1 Tax=Oceanispirochaeta sp. TaxID=2035350 RepID=UPI002620F6BE|nr:YigZ family protein [Oceanispirochaeta sp.]MDA3957430.1 YigZ family protein [Oceanispirochaeta sp.]